MFIDKDVQFAIRFLTEEDYESPRPSFLE